MRSLRWLIAASRQGDKSPHRIGDVADNGSAHGLLKRRDVQPFEVRGVHGLCEVKKEK
jgi:hypothetical protein